MKKMLLYLILFIFSFGCSEEPVETVFFNLDTQKGVFISCEGNFMYGNASLSYYNPETKTVVNQLFYARNNAPLGDVAQSLAFDGKTLFIVVNNSGKILGVDPETMEFRGIVTGLVSPRYLHFVNREKAYVSDLYSHEITVINAESFEKTGKISLTGNHTSEQMVQQGDFVFVTSWSNDEFVLVIDAKTDLLVDSIKTPFQPGAIKKDKNGKIWVMCDGGYKGSTGGDGIAALVRIEPETRTIEQIYRFEISGGFQPSGLQIFGTGDTLCFLRNGIYKMGVESRQLPEETFIEAKGRLFYSFGVNPDNNEIYVSDAIDYMQNALIYRYSHTGALIDSFKVGINPSGFLFR